MFKNYVGGVMMLSAMAILPVFAIVDCRECPDCKECYEDLRITSPSSSFGGSLVNGGGGTMAVDNRSSQNKSHDGGLPTGKRIHEVIPIQPIDHKMLSMMINIDLSEFGRDYGSGLPTGKRMHRPLTISICDGVSCPDGSCAASADVCGPDIQSKANHNTTRSNQAGGIAFDINICDGVTCSDGSCAASVDECGDISMMNRFKAGAELSKKVNISVSNTISDIPFDIIPIPSLGPDDDSLVSGISKRKCIRQGGTYYEYANGNKFCYLHAAAVDRTISPDIYYYDHDIVNNISKRKQCLREGGVRSTNSIGSFCYKRLDSSRNYSDRDNTMVASGDRCEIDGDTLFCWGSSGYGTYYPDDDSDGFGDSILLRIGRNPQTGKEIKIAADFSRESTSSSDNLIPSETLSLNFEEIKIKYVEQLSESTGSSGLNFVKILITYDPQFAVSSGPFCGSANHLLSGGDCDDENTVITPGSKTDAKGFLDNFIRSINKIQSSLAGCQTDVCKQVSINSDKRHGLVMQAHGDIDNSNRYIMKVKMIVQEDIATLEACETDVCRNVLSQEKDLLLIISNYLDLDSEDNGNLNTLGFETKTPYRVISGDSHLGNDCYRYNCDNDSNNYDNLYRSSAQDHNASRSNKTSA